jgi:regulatory protein YycI of two-component signal transduction system YycFG|tara:strand:+ start:41 stop:229 length:189 start_codon:yes stop_codon:yes gene_type:complete
MTTKNISIVIFVIIGIYIILSFRDHNFKRATDACIAGSQKLEQPMTIEEAKKFCEEKITKNK